jgi:hypothetical protein
MPRKRQKSERKVRHRPRKRQAAPETALKMRLTPRNGSRQRPPGPERSSGLAQCVEIFTYIAQFTKRLYITLSDSGH